ncbi:MAG: hypothetical protein E7393_00590 [Ruminococcaceae bacterium]|nr:hypothetical protein [Oscillospiraceae bacterium]
MAFAVYAVVFSGIGRVTTIVSMVAGLLMLYCLRTETINVNISIMSFALGIVFASILALMKDSLPYISMFVNDVLYRFAEDGYSSRFAGLQGNPNYYTMDIIVVLAVLITIMTYRETRRTHILCVVVLSIFGLMSISKSFLISLVLLLVFWLFLSIRQGGTKLTNFILVACIGSALVYFYAYDSINLYMQRFAVDSGSSLSDMTTGRTDIWKDYMNTIWHDPKILLFGNGLKSLIYTGRGAHNTYIEAFFSLGIVGVSLFCIILRKCTGKILVKPIMWIPVSMLLFRMFGITILTYDNLWFYLAIFVLLAKDMQDNSITKREG